MNFLSSIQSLFFLFYSSLPLMITIAKEIWLLIHCISILKRMGFRNFLFAITIKSADALVSKIGFILPYVPACLDS